MNREPDYQNDAKDADYMSFIILHYQSKSEELAHTMGNSRDIQGPLPDALIHQMEALVQGK